MNIQLYPHNKEAYKKVIKAFKTNNRTCICHPTGTGKSYIVAAVCQHFNKVLVIAPNMFVLNQQKEALEGHKNVSYMTYPWLMLHYSDIKNVYDIIVLDEFHRAGAEEWGTAVNLLLESQPQAKVLGTTATPVRFLDSERDMAKELFGNNIASTLSIAEAWHQNILPIPTYVTGFFSFDSIINNANEKIKNNKNYSDEEKTSRMSRLNNMRLEWQKSSGMVAILKKHLNKDVHRIIVFCAHINNLQGMQLLTKKWLRQAGFRISGTYMIHSDQSDAEQLSQMKEFSQENTSGLKLLFAINILNEGVHIPNVDAVLFLRTTSSKIIYLQQLGRCLTAANTDKPLVLDMVDNISTTNLIDGIAKELEGFEKNNSKKREESNGKFGAKQSIQKFEIFDYTLNVRQLIEKLTTRKIPLDERIEEATKFCKSKKRAPSMKYPEEYGQVLNWKMLYRHIDKDSRVLDLFVKYSPRLCHAAMFKRLLIDFVKKNNKFPSRRPNRESRSLYQFFMNHKKELLKDKEIEEIYQKYCNIDMKGIYYKKVLNFCKEHGRYPSINNLNEKDAYIAFQRFKSAARTNKKYKLLYENLSLKYAKQNRFNRLFKEIKQYAKQHGYLPCTVGEDIYSNWKTLKYHHREHPEVIKLLEEYGEATKQKVSEKKRRRIEEANRLKKFKSVDLLMQF